MTKIFTRASLLLLAVCVSGSFAKAGTVTFSVDVLQAFNLDFEPVAIPDLNSIPGSPVILNVGLSVTAIPGDGQRDFLNMAVDIGLNGFTDVGGGYNATASPQVDINPSPIVTNNQPVYATNQDAGAADLMGIVLSKTVPLADTDARTLFETSNIEFGQLYLQWDGTGPASLSISGVAQFNFPGGDVQPPSEAFDTFTFTVGGGVGGDGPDLGPGGALDFGYNGQSQIITLTNTGDETANFLGGQFEITGANAGLFSLVNADFTPIAAGGSRQFEVLFNSGSNAQASYEAQLTFLTDAATNPSFLLTAQVPEPSTVALAGLGMVGLVGLARRRRK